MSDLLRRRRAMMGQAKAEEEELYPVGTDIVDEYIRKQSGFKIGKINNLGDFESVGAYYASEDYIPVNPKYTYRKNDYRLGSNSGGYCAWYDASKSFISAFAQDNLNVQNLPKAPSKARYLRISTRNQSNAVNLKIIRIA